MDGGRGVLNITAVAWTVGFQWWHSGDIRQMQNVSEYMLVLALCLVYIAFINVTVLQLYENCVAAILFFLLTNSFYGLFATCERE